MLLMMISQSARKKMLWFYSLRTALSKNCTVWEHSLSGQVWTKFPTRHDTQGAPRGGCSLHPHSVYHTATMISHIVNSHRYKVTNVNHGSEQLHALSNDSKYCTPVLDCKVLLIHLHYHLCWITFHCAPAENDCFPTFGSMEQLIPIFKEHRLIVPFW